MYFKKLVGKQCYLSPVDPEDSEKFTLWLNDLEITRNLTLYTSYLNLDRERKFMDNVQDHTYSIVDLATDELIGNCGFDSIDHVNQSAQVGIFIGNKEYWGRGYGPEVMSLLVDFGFRVLNLHNISLRTYSYNKRAIRCYEKVGFKLIGSMREALLRGEERYDIIYMDILPGDFYGKDRGASKDSITVV